MATFTTYLGGPPIVATSGAVANSVPAQTVLVNTFDATRRQLVALDVVEVLKIPKNTLVHKVLYRVDLAEGAGGTFNIGDGDDGDGYVAAASSATAGAGGVGAGALAAGKFYAVDDTIDIEVPATMTLAAGKITVIAVVTMVG